MTNKKGIAGIGVLLLFIAIILISVIVVSALINLVDKYSDQRRIQKVIRNNYDSLEIIEIAGFDAREQNISLMTIDVRLRQSQDKINLENVLLEVASSDFHSLLKSYAGIMNVNNNSGYNTWSPQEFDTLQVGQKQLSFNIDAITEGAPYVLPIDLDDDGSNDSIYSCDDSGTFCPAGYDGNYLMVDLTSTATDYFVELVNQDGSIGDISTVPETLDIQKAAIGTVGYISITGTVTQADRIGYNFEDVKIFKIPELLDDDLDDDRQNDYVYLNSTHAIFELSSLSSDIALSLDADLTSVPAIINLQKKISDGTTSYGTLNIVAQTTTPDQIDASDTVTVTHISDGNGYYSAEYLKKGPYYVSGFASSGDIIRLTAEMYRPLVENEEAQISLVTHNAQYVTKNIFTGHTIPYTNKYVIFPKITSV